MTTNEPSNHWGINNDYAQLHDVLLGVPEYFQWVEAGPLIGRTLQNAHKTGAKFDLQLAMSQHAEMVRIYETNGVRCHYLESDPVLHRNFFARDSSAMTPWGALICHMQLKVRRADYVTAIKFYQENAIPIWQYATAGHFEGGDFVILEPGKVLIGYCGERSEQAGSEQVADFVRQEGWEAITAPISREFVHMDGLVVPLAEKLLVACVDALEPWLVQQLRDWGFDFVDVPYIEAKTSASIWYHSATTRCCRCQVLKSSTTRCAVWDLRCLIRICRCLPWVVVASIALPKPYVAMIFRLAG